MATNTGRRASARPPSAQSLPLDHAARQHLIHQPITRGILATQRIPSGQRGAGGFGSQDIAQRLMRVQGGWRKGQQKRDDDGY
jgi:hypothetical protein